MAGRLCGALVAFVLLAACGNNRSAIEKAPNAGDAAAQAWLVKSRQGPVLVDPPGTVEAAEALINDLGNDGPLALILTGGPPSPLDGLAPLAQAYPQMEVLTTARILDHLRSAGTALPDRIAALEDHPTWEVDDRAIPSVILGGEFFMVVEPVGEAFGPEPRLGLYMPYPTHANFIGAMTARDVVIPLLDHENLEHLVAQSSYIGGAWCDVEACPMTYARWGDVEPWSTPDMVFADWQTDTLEALRLMVRERIDDDGRLSAGEYDDLQDYVGAIGALIADNDTAAFNRVMDRLARDALARR